MAESEKKPEKNIGYINNDTDKLDLQLTLIIYYPKQQNTHYSQVHVSFSKKDHIMDLKVQLRNIKKKKKFTQ